MQDRPTVQELLAAVRGFLEEEIIPSLEGRRRFHALVAANVLAVVARELVDEEQALLTEWQGLVRLLGRGEVGAPARLEALRTAVRELTAELASRIQRGDADAEPLATAVRGHVRATVREKLRVANPRFLGS